MWNFDASVLLNCVQSIYSCTSSISRDCNQLVKKKEKKKSKKNHINVTGIS